MKPAKPALCNDTPSGPLYISFPRWMRNETHSTAEECPRESFVSWLQHNICLFTAFTLWWQCTHGRNESSYPANQAPSRYRSLGCSKEKMAEGAHPSYLEMHRGQHLQARAYRGALVKGLYCATSSPCTPALLNDSILPTETNKQTAEDLKQT